jgi:long-subunit fatty acid transport protein
MSPHAKHGIALLLAVLPALVAQAQGGPLGSDRSVPPTPSPVGSGARAAGMANAFVAIADDATAAAWNPAGLVQLERPELSIAGEALWTRDSMASGRHPELDGEHPFSDAALNFLSAVYPIPRPILGRNVVLSLSYQRRYDFTRSFDADLNTVQSGPGGIFLGQHTTLDFEQSGGLGALSPSLAFEITKTLSVGISANFVQSRLWGEDGWEQTTRVDSRFNAGSAVSWSRGESRESYEDVRGQSVTLGLLWRATSQWTLGLRYDSALRAKADYSAFDRDLRIVPNPAAPLVLNRARLDETRRLRFPATVSLGAAFRPNDRLTLAADISRTDWNKAYVKAGDGTKYSLIDGADLGDPRRRTDFDPAWAVRLGAEYTFIPKVRGETLDYLWSMRGGLFLEQEPASGRNPRRPFDPGDGKPDNFYGVSVGAGLLLKQRINLDVAYQFRFGDDVNGDLNPGVTRYRGDEESHRLIFSTVFYF